MTLKGGQGGGGGRAGDVRAGGAFYEMYVKENVAKELEKAKQKTSAFTQYLKGVGQGLSGSLLFGGLTGAGVAFGTKVLGPAMDKLQEGIEDALFGTKSIAEEAKKAADSYGAMAKSASATAASALATAAKFKDPGQAVGFLTEARDRLSKDLAFVRRRELFARNASAVAEGNIPGQILAALGFGDAKREAAGKRADAAGASAESILGNLNDLNRRITELMSGDEVREKFRGAVDALSLEIDDALDPNIAAMGKFERALLELERSGAISDVAGDITWLKEKALAADAAMKPAAGGGLAALMFGGIQAAMAAAPGAAAMRERLQGMLSAFDGAKGSFGGRASELAFSLGDVTRRQEDLLKQIVGTGEDTVKAVGALADALRMGP